jgi:hypothetical protein
MITLPLMVGHKNPRMCLNTRFGRVWQFDGPDFDPTQPPHKLLKMDFVLKQFNLAEQGET